MLVRITSESPDATRLLQPVVGPSSITEEILTSTNQLDKFDRYIIQRLHEQ
jgi:hypothetical protein